MHELMITEDLIRLVLEANEKNQTFKAVNEVSCELGLLTTYKPEPIMFYFDILKKDNLVLKESRIKIKEVVGKILCNKCSKESEISEPYELFCGHCESDDVKIIQGQDFRIIEFKGE